MIDHFDVGVGVDVEAVERFLHPDARLFTKSELEQCATSGVPAQSRAGRWCAKEAVVKAASKFVLLSPREVEVLADDGGRPCVTIHRELDKPITFDVSIAHVAAMAMAVAVAHQPHPRVDSWG